jgi:16S rRNA (guanine527-N7)-methyltransferase
VTPDDVGRLLNVSRETLDQFAQYLALLEKWQKHINLIASSTLETAWQRHVLDSGQLAAHLPEGTGRILDIGSGAGFPGLILAIMCGCEVELVESDQRKAIFMRTVIRELGLSARVHNCRIETLPPRSPDVITARALAPLPKLLNLIENQVHSNVTCLFLKGASVEQELTNLASYSTMALVTHPSLSDPEGVVLKLVSRHRGG